MDHTINAMPTFPAGATIGAYKLGSRDRFPGGAPSIAATATAVVQAAGTATFVGLEYATRYVAYYATSGRSISFTTPAFEPTVGPAGPVGATGQAGPAGTGHVEVGRLNVGAVTGGASKTVRFTFAAAFPNTAYEVAVSQFMATDVLPLLVTSVTKAAAYVDVVLFASGARSTTLQMVASDRVATGVAS